MKDLDELTSMVDKIEAVQGDRYEQLSAAHDALREALAHTDGDPQAAGR